MDQAIKESLISKMKSVNALLQEVSDALGPEVTEFERISDMRLRFPRGYIRTAGDFRNRLKCVKDSTAQSNIAYQLMMSDLYSWLLNRTDISLTVKEMVIKYEIVIMASIAETLTVIFTTDKKTFKERLPILVSNNKISSETARELSWIWDTRMGIHLFKLDESEHNKYEEADFDRAAIAVRKLVDELNTKC